MSYHIIYRLKKSQLTIINSNLKSNLTNISKISFIKTFELLKIVIL